MTKKQDKPFKSIFRQVTKWQDLWFYQKSEALYQMTCVFCERFLPQYGDRTVDQMVQAARSGKQNIVEGSEDGKTSTEMVVKLLNVARSSIGELRQDYIDFLRSRQLHQWTAVTSVSSLCRTLQRSTTSLPTMNPTSRNGG